MSGKGGLYACEDPASWKAVLNIYQDVIEAMGSKKKRLIALDQWYQEELPEILAGRKEKHLTKDELLKLMEWKLTRGKFRPRLQQLVAANPSKMVEEHTRKAFHQLPDLEVAVKDLNELKGVGPATASAILAAGAPGIAAFMADEVMETLPGLGPLQYTLKHYLLYMDKIQSCVKKLNKGNTTETWTAHLVEKCLWTWALAQKLHLPSLPIGDANTVSPAHLHLLLVKEDCLHPPPLQNISGEAHEILSWMTVAEKSTKKKK